MAATVPLRFAAAQMETAGTCPAVPPMEGWLFRLLDDDLDAAVLRLADTIGGLHQQAGLADAHGDRRAGTPSRTSASLTALARRSDSAML